MFFLALAGFVLSALETWHGGYGWHDQQRIYQLMLISVAAASVLFTGVVRLNRVAFGVLLVILLLGATSAFMAEWSLWAFREWARYVGLALLSVLIAKLASRYRWQEIILYLLALAAGISAFQFLMFYLMAFVTGIRLLDVDILFSGFSNPRFLGQFQVLLMPVLAWLAAHHWQGRAFVRYSKLLGGLFFAILVVHWCLAVALGGRGLWVSLLVSHLAILVLAPRFRQLITVQLMAAVSGVALFLILFLAIPEWLGIETTVRDGLRWGLSKREFLWGTAWDISVANPWFGVGPMHFAANMNSVAAHPHQVVFQWLAEWGWPATLLALVLGVWGMVHGVLFLRSAKARSLDAAIWISITGALVLAQVDGVFVMPYTETWLAILIGLAMARWSSQSIEVSSWQMWSWRILSVPVLVVLLHVLIVDVSTLPEDSEAFMEKHGVGWSPRFWLQGWIPMKEVD